MATMAKKPTKQNDPKRVIREEIELDAIDQKLLAIECQYPGYTDEELGEHVGLARAAVNRRRNKPAFKRAYAQYTLPARERMESPALLSKAARKIESLIDKGEDNVAERAATKVLTSAGILKHEAQVQLNLPRPVIITMGDKKLIAGVPEAIEALTKEEKN